MTKVTEWSFDLSTDEGRYHALWDSVQDKLKNVPTNLWNAALVAQLKLHGLALSRRLTREYQYTAPRAAIGYKPQWPHTTYVVEESEVHPLHPEKLVFMIDREEPDPNRSTGRTTILALQYIAEAMEKPGELILLRDHYPTRQAHEHLMRMVRQMISQLGFQHLHIAESVVYDCWVMQFKR